MRTFTLSFLTLFLSSLVTLNAQSFHDFTANSLDGVPIDMSIFEGKKVLVVNTASYCVYTPQYTDLQELFETYGGAEFTVLGFPANDFLNQEPGDPDQIDSVCEAHGVTFKIMEKIQVVDGANQHPIYNWLTKQSENGVQDAPVSWNFQKFMVGPNGEWQGVVEPNVSPLDPVITEWAAARVSGIDAIDQKDKDALTVIQTGDQLSVDVSSFNSNPYHFTVFNSAGAMILNGTDTKSQLVFSGQGLMPGAYFIEIRSKDFATSGRFVK